MLRSRPEPLLDTGEASCNCSHRAFTQVGLRAWILKANPQTPTPPATRGARRSGLREQAQAVAAGNQSAQSLPGSTPGERSRCAPGPANWLRGGDLLYQRQTLPCSLSSSETEWFLHHFVPPFTYGTAKIPSALPGNWAGECQSSPRTPHGDAQGPDCLLPIRSPVTSRSGHVTTLGEPRQRRIRRH